MELTIVFEDSNLVIINKPPGLITHPKNLKDTSESVTGWFLKKYPEAKNVGEDPARPGIVHRLDRETSGILILAKNQESYLYLKSLFKNREIKKQYFAVLSGSLKSNKGTIDLPIGRIGLKRTTQLKNGKLNDPKPAHTEYQVLRRTEEYTLVQAKPKTGRMHQLRVHFKALGHPIVCDRIYGGKNMACPMVLGRLGLHAQMLEFVSPDGKSMVVEADLPEDLQNFISTLE